jgi:adenylosuccinate synthase
MGIVTVIGTQWGDEGKGKIVDLLAEKAQCIARFQGGNNAGHTLVINGTVYKLNLLPSGIIRDDTISYIGNGVVLDPFALIAEIKTATDKGLVITPEKLVISESCHLILPIHKVLDGVMEDARGSESLGTTLKGIGPSYEDKVARRGIRVIDLKYPDILKSRLESLIEHHNAFLRGMCVAEHSSEDIYTELMDIAPTILSYTGSVGHSLEKAYQQGKNILFEGAQGSLLDIDHGTYPYVTSSNTAAGQSAAGSGFGAARKAHVIGLAKAYTTRVGSGSFPTELFDSCGDHLSEKGHEFGTVTGRKRRCGWFDAVLVKHSCLVSDVDSIALTKLDVLDGLKEIKICTGYKINGVKLDNLPAHHHDWQNIEPIFETLPGWSGTTQGIRSLDKLPVECKNYVSRLEQLIGKPISIISTSPEREDTIILKSFF